MDIEDLPFELATQVRMETQPPAKTYSDMAMDDLVAEFVARFHPFSQKRLNDRWLMISHLLEDDMKDNIL